MTPDPWPSERVERLKTLWAAGNSAGVIAKTIGGTRNSIIGKLHRIGIRRGGQPIIRAKRHSLAKPRPPAPVRELPPLPPRLIPIEPPAPAVAGRADGVPLAAVVGRAGRCRYILNDPPRGRMLAEGIACGAPTGGGHDVPWCATCREFVFPRAA